ncbi:MAG: DUF935 family protein [Candidatus Tokpelaia sp.]|nr:MAG: DUF935 family protein [Candidatus Tokpelaia sp.]KAA6205731.1 MAG: DUF935 family protein [Candidatus Tokpelaia sp.]
MKAAVSGGHAVAKEHRLVQEDIEWSDAEILGATLNAQLIPNIIAFNFGPQDEYPTISIGRPDALDLDKIINAVEKLGPQGLTVETSWLRDQIGAPDPAKGAELVGGRPAPAQSAQSFARLPALNTAQMLNNRQQRQDSESDEITQKLLERAENDTAAAMTGLTEKIRQVLLTATDLRDAADRLAALQLSPAELSNAMARSMALAHLAGQAAMIDDINRRK